MTMPFMSRGAGLGLLCAIATLTVSAGGGPPQVKPTNLCAFSLKDAATGACDLRASSLPVLGKLYPLSEDLSVEAGTGHVGLGTTSPIARLDVRGSLAVGGQVVVDDQGNWVAGHPGGLSPKAIAMLQWYSVGSQVTFVPTGTSRVTGLAFDGQEMWVAGGNADNLKALDVADGNTVVGVSIDGVPTDVAFDGTYVWSANNAHGNLSRVRVSDGLPIPTDIAAGHQPIHLAFDGRLMWTTNAGDDTLQWNDVGDPLVSNVLPLGGSPRDLAVTGEHVWVAVRSGALGWLSKRRVSDGAEVLTVPVGTDPWGVAFDGLHVWVTNEGDDTVTRVREVDGVIAGTFPVGDEPRGIAFDGQALWVSNYADTATGNSVTKLRAVDGQLLGTFDVGTHPWPVAFDGCRVWVGNTDDGTLSLF